MARLYPASCHLRRGQGTFVTAEKGRIDALRSKLQKEAVGAFVKQMRAMGLAGAGIVQAVSDYLSRETDDGEKERGTN